MDFYIRFIFYAVGMYIFYLIIKSAVRNAIRDSMDDIKEAIRDSVEAALDKYQYDKDSNAANKKQSGD